MTDYEPYYPGYTFEELLDAQNRLDREAYPERAKRLDEEITRRKEGDNNPWLEDPVEAFRYPRSDSLMEEPGDRESEEGSQKEEGPQYLPIVFTGSAREYFRIWIVNLCLTLVTCGIFSAWAKVRKKRYTYSHTSLDGTPFQYLGQPIPILKGRFIAAIGFLVYYLSSHFFNSLLPYVLGAGLIAAPWVLVRSAAFNARYSAFRNMTFHFGGTYWRGAQALYMWGIVPVGVISMMVPWQGQAIVLGVASAAFGITFPFWIRRLKRFLIDHTSFGGKTGFFTATGGQFFKIYFVSGLITIAVAIPIVVLLMVFAQKMDSVVAFLGTIPMYAGYVAAFAFVQSRSGNLVWNHTRLGPFHFRSDLRWTGLIRLYVTNALGIIFSCGLLIPWAVMRTLKYRADHLQVVRYGTFSEFQGDERTAVAAVGAETMDFFDVDLSL